MKRTLIITVIVIAIVAITMSPIYIGLMYGTMPTLTEFWLQYTSIILSSTSFIAVIYTIWKQGKAEQEHQVEINQNYDFAKQNYDMQILNIIEKFSSDSMIGCKKSCNIIYSKWSDKTFMEEFKNILKSEACGYTNSNFNSTIAQSEAYKCFEDFMQVSHFFNILSFYNYNKNTAKAVQYYYDFYRTLFVRIHVIYEDILKELPSENIKNHKDYFYTQWSDILKRFDKIMREYASNIESSHSPNYALGGQGEFYNW